MPGERRGFASMDPKRQKEIASKGGIAAHESGNAHEFTPDEARAAGRKGGEAVSRNRAHMAAIGRMGGEASAAKRVNRAANQNTGAARARSSSRLQSESVGDESASQVSSQGSGQMSGESGELSIGDISQQSEL